MNRAIAWFAGNHVAANLLMMLLVVGGLLSIPSIKQELMPELSLDLVTVRVAYPGAAPIEIEEGICIRIEEELQGLQGVKRISSTAAEGLCLVSVELMAGEDVRRRLDEIRSRVDGIESFPEEAEKPVIVQADVRFQVLDVAVSGDVDEVTLKRLGQQVRDEIAALPGVTDVELVATRPYEVAIEVSEDALLRHDLTFDHVVRAVRRSSLDLPGGSVKTAGGEILIRTKGQAYRGGEFEKRKARGSDSATSPVWWMASRRRTSWRTSTDDPPRWWRSTGWAIRARSRSRRPSGSTSSRREGDSPPA